MDIAGKVALVTGGANGIGKAMVDIMLQKQAKGIFILDISEIALKEVQEELNKKYGEGKVHGCKCDVSSVEQMEACFKKAISTFGELHIVCNNAGIVNEITWQRMLEINVKDLQKTGLAELRKIESNLITTFSPEVVKKKIRVNVLCPAAVMTPILGSMVMADAKHQEIVKTCVADGPPLPVIQPHELVEHFVKLIEEPQHGQTMYVPDAQTHEIIKDEHKVFRERSGIEEPYMKLRDAAV